MKGYLTTHVLDTARGCPASGVEIELFRLAGGGGGGGRALLNTLTTNADGRTDSPILGEAEFATGEYELVFHAGAYHSKVGDKAGGKAGGFLDTVPIRFCMGEAAHYHVPLLLSPFGYSTYRGS